MRARKGLAAVMIAGAVLAGGGALAETTPLALLVPGVPPLGASLEEAQAMALPEAHRLLCDSDTEHPPLADPALVRAREGLGGTHLKLCTVIAPAGGHAWDTASMTTLAGPARVWLLFVEQGGNGSGHYRLARVSLWAQNGGWDRVAEALGTALGAPAVGTNRLLSWEDGRQETLMFEDTAARGGFAVSVTDLRLRRLLKSPGLTGRDR
jgi:hypothetical protein